MILEALFSCLIIIVPNICCQTVTTEDFSYNAAVVEYKPEQYPGIPEEDSLLLRAKNHIDLLKNISQDIEIVVFPESTLTIYGDISQLSTPIPRKYGEIICNSTRNQYKDFLKLFSCASIDHNVSIAINVIEKGNCSESRDGCNTSQDGDPVYFNTVVVFDENGYVSGRYRKWNLFGEFQLTTPKNMDITVIKTKNNISFGIITCFDINFSTPSMNLTRGLNIENIIFPNNWISELPYLTALQVQQMWAQENNVVLLASGTSNPKNGASGSGIFLGKYGPSETVFHGGNGKTQVILQTIPKLQNNTNKTGIPLSEEDTDELAKDLDDFFLLRDLSMNDHSSILMEENETNVIEDVCDGDLIKTCCKFDITIKVNETSLGKHRYRYHLVAFNGIRSFSGLRYAGIEACGIVACLNESLSSCALRFPNYTEIFWPIIFEKIQIEATFIKDENRVQYPNSLLASMRPISPKYAAWDKTELDGFVKREHILKKPENRLMTFGIFGRDFNRDTSLIILNKGSRDIHYQRLFWICVFINFVII